MINTTRHTHLAICAMSIALLGVATSAFAQAKSVFINDISGTGPRSFTDTTIWPDGAMPLTIDQAVIDKGDGINDYVYVDSALQIARFNVGNQNTGGLELRNGAYLFLDQGSSQTNVGPSGSGVNDLPGVGYLRIKTGATLDQTGVMYLGLNTQGTGTATLEAGGTHQLGTNLIIGSAGTGTYNMQGGSLTTGNYLMVGNTATGNGTFKQADGVVQINRTHASNHGLYLGFTAGATALYEISGGTLNVAATNQGFMNGTNAATGGSAATFRVVGSGGTINIGNHYIQRSGAALDMVIGGTGVSPLNIGGNATLDSGSILKASFSATPLIGQQFTIMNYTGSLTGTFSTFDSLVDSPLGPNSVQLSVNYGTLSGSSIVLTVDSLVTAQAGDFDGDGDVDGADFVAWQTNFPKTSGAVRGQGDNDGDGDVDGADFAGWQSGFPSPSGVTPVPEPHSVLMAATAGIAFIITGRQLRRRNRFPA